MFQLFGVYCRSKGGALEEGSIPFATSGSKRLSHEEAGHSTAPWNERVPAFDVCTSRSCIDDMQLFECRHGAEPRFLLHWVLIPVITWPLRGSHVNFAAAVHILAHVTVT